MINQILLIHENFILYDILTEIGDEFGFSIQKFKYEDIKKIDKMNNPNYLFISEKKIKNFKNQIVLDTLPISIFKLFENINLNFLKLKFKNQSNIILGNYLLDINSREMSSQNQKLKLTEMEVKMIIYLFNIKKVVKVDELRLNVWGHQSKLETHTVETHIYRLRKKILRKFNDNKFIISLSGGYQVK